MICPCPTSPCTGRCKYPGALVPRTPPRKMFYPAEKKSTGSIVFARGPSVAKNVHIGGESECPPIESIQQLYKNLDRKFCSCSDTIIEMHVRICKLEKIIDRMTPML